MQMLIATGALGFAWLLIVSAKRSWKSATTTLKKIMEQELGR